MRLLSPDRLLGVILIAVLTILLLVVIWSLDRGLDITDESLTLLSYLYPGEYPANFSMSYTIVDRITGWMHPSVVGYRWITLALILLTATAFFCGFWQWLRRFVAAEPRRAVSLAVVFPYLLIGWLSVYGIGLVTLNYNTLNSACLASVAGAFLHPRSRAKAGRPAGQDCGRPVHGGLLLSTGFIREVSDGDHHVRWRCAPDRLTHETPRATHDCIRHRYSDPWRDGRAGSLFC